MIHSKDKSKEIIKVNYLTGYMSPHLVPLLNAFSEHRAVKLKVWYCNRDITFRTWLHDIKPIHSYNLSKKTPLKWLHKEFHLDTRIIKFIKDNDADLNIVSEYDIPTLRLAIIFMNRQKIFWALRGERPILGEKSLIKKIAGCIIRHKPIKTCQAIIANGSWNAHIYRELAPWGKKIYSVPYYVDPNLYSFPPTQGKDYLCRLIDRKISEKDFIFLFVGSLIPRKGIFFLIDAYNKVAECFSNAFLCIAGEGPLKESLKNKLSPNAFKRTFFLDNLGFKEVGLIYAAANVFVFPTQFDGWGAVVNEAMASGLPVITTTSCGAAYDLVYEGKNGFVITPNDLNGLIERMIELISKPDLAKKMGEKSRRIMKNQTPKDGAELLYRVCMDIIENR